MDYKLEMKFNYCITSVCGGGEMSRTKKFEAPTDEAAREKAAWIVKKLISKKEYGQINHNGKPHELNSVSWKLTKTASEGRFFPGKNKELSKDSFKPPVPA